MSFFTFESQHPTQHLTQRGHLLNICGWVEGWLVGRVDSWWVGAWLDGQIDEVLWNLFLIYLTLYYIFNISSSPLTLNATDYPQISLFGSNLPCKLWTHIYVSSHTYLYFITPPRDAKDIQNLKCLKKYSGPPYNIHGSQRVLYLRKWYYNWHAFSGQKPIGHPSLLFPTHIQSNGQLSLDDL